MKKDPIDFRYLQRSKKVEERAANPDPWEGRIPHANIGRIINEAQLLSEGYKCLDLLEF